MSVYTENINHINKLHPSVRQTFIGFENDCRAAGLEIKIYSSLRTWQNQAYLYNLYKQGRGNPAARPGNSFHNYGFAIDFYVYSSTSNKYVREYELYQKVDKIAKKYGIFWLGSKIRSEMHHFDMGGQIGAGRTSLRNKLKTSFLEGKVDDDNYVLLDEEVGIKYLETFQQSWSIEIGAEAITTNKIDEEPPEPIYTTKLAKVEELNAVGIWQIVKLVADQYSLSQNVNDATIAYNQGSLFNFVQKVVQKPWLQFWGDTINDQYYFFVRKEPYDYNGWVELPTMDNITDQSVLSDDLDWYNGDIFSWFQIIPRGSFLGQQDLIFAYVTAVFFEEYAEIWGSKPNIQVSNYVNFKKINGQSSMLDKALEDLRYMVESNMYLPFTRQGTIVLRGKSNLKRGYKINYFPTGEVFYVDAVSHRYNITETGPEFTTVLQVSRGMKMEYVIAPTGPDTISYFNIINFDNPPNLVEKTIETVKDGSAYFYFDNARNYLIDLDENFENENDTISKKMQEQINDFPELRAELHNRNSQTIDLAADLINKHPDAKQFISKGFVDSDGDRRFDRLAKQRAVTVKTLIIESYISKYNHFTKAQLEEMIIIEFDVSGNTLAAFNVDGQPLDYNDIAKSDNERKLKVKAYQRYCRFYMKPYEVEKETETEQKGVNWSVNDKVFQYFLNRKQFANEQ